MSDPMSSTKTQAGEPNGKLKRKEYEQELARLHVGSSSSSNGSCTRA